MKSGADSASPSEVVFACLLGGPGAVPAALPGKAARLPLRLVGLRPDIEKRRRQRVALRGPG